MGNVGRVNHPVAIQARSDFNFQRILVLLIAACGWFLAGGCATTPAKTAKQTYSSFDLPSEHVPPDKATAGCIDFQGVPLDDVLKIYQALSCRTVIRGTLPMASIT